MHEMGLAEAILGVVLDVAGNRPVKRVRVRVGTRQAVVAESLSFGFGLLVDGTPLHEATLEVSQVPGDEVRVDEVVLAGGDVIRRPGLEVIEAGHDEHNHRSRHPAWL